MFSSITQHTHNRFSSCLPQESGARRPRPRARATGCPCSLVDLSSSARDIASNLASFRHLDTGRSLWRRGRQERARKFRACYHIARTSSRGLVKSPPKSVLVGFLKYVIIHDLGTRGEMIRVAMMIRNDVEQPPRKRTHRAWSCTGLSADSSYA